VRVAKAKNSTAARGRGVEKPMQANALPLAGDSRSLHSSASRFATGAELDFALDFFA
jgi:hypothetical protein